MSKENPRQIVNIRFPTNRRTNPIIRHNSKEFEPYIILERAISRSRGKAKKSGKIILRDWYNIYVIWEPETDEFFFKHDCGDENLMWGMIVRALKKIKAEERKRKI